MLSIVLPLLAIAFLPFAVALQSLAISLLPLPFARQPLTVALQPLPITLPSLPVTLLPLALELPPFSIELPPFTLEPDLQLPQLLVYPGAMRSSAARSSSKATGLVRCALKPAARAFSISSSMPKPLIAMPGSLYFVFSVRMSAKPL